MINLLQVELKKIFKKKSIYVIWMLMLIFCLLNNILYKTDYDEDGNYKYLDQDNLKEEKNNLESELEKYNPENNTEATMYITIKTKLDILNLKQQFTKKSWQYKKLSTYLYDIIYKINYYQYIENNPNQLLKEKEQYQVILNKLYNNNYKYFLNIEIEEIITLQTKLKEQYTLEQDKINKQELEKQIEDNNFKLKILNYRVNNNIKEDTSYLNNALESYQENYKTVKYYEKLGNKKTYQEKITYQEALSETAIFRYIIENQKNINKQNNLNYQLRTIIEDYEIFIIMLIVIVSSIIICDEFKDGTIKLLLIKPYYRGKILLSKYLTTIIVLFVSIILLIVMQLIIGGIIFGFDSLDIPVVTYNFNNSKLIEYSIIKYMMMRIITKTPFLIILITISCFLGVLSNSSIITITIPLMLYMFTPTMTYLTIKYQLNFMKYLVNINWNLSEYLFGKLPANPTISLQFSSIILLIYFIVLWILTNIIFKKKNIKNI